MSLTAATLCNHRVGVGRVVKKRQRSTKIGDVAVMAVVGVVAYYGYPPAQSLLVWIFGLPAVLLFWWLFLMPTSVTT